MPKFESVHTSSADTIIPKVISPLVDTIKPQDSIKYTVAADMDSIGFNDLQVNASDTIPGSDKIPGIITDSGPSPIEATHPISITEAGSAASSSAREIQPGNLGTGISVKESNDSTINALVINNQITDQLRSNVPVLEVPEVADLSQIEDSISSSDYNVKPFLKESILVNGSVSEDDVSGYTLFKSSALPGWYFFLLFGALLFIAWVKSNYGSILLKTYQASVNIGVTLRMFKDNSQLQKQLDNILYAIYFFSFSIYLLLIESKFNLYPFGLEGIKLLLFNMLFLVSLFFGRIIFIGILGFIFRQQALFREYRYNIFVFNKLVGIIIIPFLLFIMYSAGPLKNVLEWTSLATLVAVILLRVYRGLEFSIKKGVFILYLFLYLCALEIVPILVLFKWMESVI